MIQPGGHYNASYSKDMAIARTNMQWGLLIAFLVLLFCLPLFLPSRFLEVMIGILITIIAVQGLNVLTGLSGQISLGQAAFSAAGAYTAGILTTNLGWSFWAAFPISALAAGLLGVGFAIPAARIKGFYLALITLASHFIILWVIKGAINITKGDQGLSVDSPQIGSLAFDTSQRYYYLAAVFAILVTVLTQNICRTKVGRALLAIRDNDLAAQVMGINLFFYRILAFFICCLFAGVAGSLWGYYVGVLHPSQYSLMDSVWYLGMLIVGGLGSTVGAIFGVFALKILDYALGIVAPVEMASIGPISYGLIILLFLIFEPRGLNQVWLRIKSFYRLWPMPYLR